MKKGATGLNEAIPAGKYAGQFFDHLGFEVLDEWYILSEFHGSEINSTTLELLQRLNVKRRTERG